MVRLVGVNQAIRLVGSYGDILGVALKMDQLQGAMFEFTFLASAVPHGDQFTFGSALRRIQNVQDRA